MSLSVSLIGLLMWFIVDDNLSLPIIQSQICSEKEMRTQIQCFKKIPKLKYVVLQNESVIIPCVVNNQHGKVQWRAKSLVLGYDRSLPGMPRMNIIGDVTKGEHNLKISNIKLSDSGEYECQVQPVGVHPILRRRSTIVVTVLPSEPVIFYNNKIPKGDEIMLDSDINHIQNLEIKCISKGGSPPPSFFWFWNSRPVHSDVYSDSNNKRKDSTTSVFQMASKYLSSGHIIRCSVRNMATDLLQSTDGYDKEIRILIYTRPRAPKIENLFNVQNLGVPEGENTELICSVKEVEKLVTKIIWTISSFKGSEYITDAPNTLWKAKKELVSKLTIKNVTSENHNSNILCTVENPITNVSSNPYRLLVKYFPKELSILSLTNHRDHFLKNQSYVSSVIERNHEKVISGIENEDIDILCYTGPYYGNVDLTWELQEGEHIDGTKLASQILSPLLKGNYLNVTTNTIQSFVTQKIKLKRNFNSGFIECCGLNLIGKRLSVRSGFNVLYLPKLSVVSSYVSQFPVQEGDIIQLTCCAYGGNPIPFLRWLKNNMTILQTSVNVTQPDEQTLVFMDRVYRKDNGKVLHCEAESQILSRTIVTSNSVTINVVFPPTKLDIRCENCNTSSLMENTKATIVCETSSSNPGSTITWRFVHCNVKFRFEGPEGVLSTNIPSTHKGWKTQSRINLLVNHSYNGCHLECRSELSYKMFPKKYKVLIKSIQLTVQHPPVVLTNTSGPLVFQVKEGSDVSLFMPVVSNPKPHSFLWKIGKTNISFTENLIITNIQRKQSGFYAFSATNDFGSVTTSVFIDVLYIADLVGATSSIENNTAILWCHFKMNPMSDMKNVSWIKLKPTDRLIGLFNDDENAGEFVCNNSLEWNSSQRIRSTCSMYPNNTLQMVLRIDNVGQNDFGHYQCSVDNGLGKRGTADIFSAVPIQPIPLHVRHFSKQGADLKEIVVLTCCFYSHTEPIINWYLPLNNRRVDSNNISEYSSGVYCGTLQFSVVTVKEYGKYKCQAYNKLAYSEVDFVTLLPPFEPEFPEKLQILPLTNDSLQVLWIQPSDGGSFHFYKIRWRTKNKESEVNYNIVEGKKTSEILSTTISSIKSTSRKVFN